MQSQSRPGIPSIPCSCPDALPVGCLGHVKPPYLDPLSSTSQIGATKMRVLID